MDMVSTKTKSLILFVIAFGLLVIPITFFLQSQSELEPETPGSNFSAAPPPASMQQVKRYQGVLDGKVISKEDSMIISAISDYGNVDNLDEFLLSFDGVKSTNITKEDNPGETGLYLYSIKLEVDPDKTEKIGYFIMMKIGDEPYSFRFDSVGVPAKIAFPEEVALKRVLTGETKEISMPPEVLAFVFSYTNVDDTSAFTVDVTFSGNEKNVFALERSRLYQPPTETSYETGEATVLNVTGYGFISTTDYGEEVDPTELEQELLSRANATVYFSKPLGFFEVAVNNSNRFVETLNTSGITAQATPGGAIVWIGESLNSTLSTMEEAAPGIEYQVPKGTLTVETKDLPLPSGAEPLFSLVPGELSQEYFLGCFLVDKYNDTVCGELPVDVQEGEALTVNITVKSIFGDIHHPVRAKTLS